MPMPQNNTPSYTHVGLYMVRGAHPQSLEITLIIPSSACYYLELRNALTI